jgi:hypothetical protein
MSSPSSCAHTRSDFSSMFERFHARGIILNSISTAWLRAGRRSPLCPLAKAGGTSKSSEQFNQCRLAKRQLPGIRRLYAIRRILESARGTEGVWSRTPDRDHVRRNCPLAVSSVIDLRCPDGSRLGDPPHPVCPNNKQAPIDGIRRDRWHKAYISHTNWSQIPS